MFSAGGRTSSSIETGTKMYISNLDYGVSNEDIKELFAEVGGLKSLDGKPKKIELVGTTVLTSGAILPPARAFANPSVALRTRRQRRGCFGKPRDRGRGRGWVRGREEKVSAEDLNVDLEKYHANAMQIN
ncbi:UNVERIFIED_CONTAM: THO complex subunitA [Sesamum angustifolium]|uniref:THO complex subunitA n=1 Tax=Sesamum angustifolium TaxID=2727405 RepID=A0AAW2J5T2_9LAMI